MDKRIVIASNNAHKVEEIRSILDFDGWQFLTLSQAGIESDPYEDADTFLENARIKAQAAHRLCGCAVLADDSGLEVDVLGGKPGVFSARFAGEDATDAQNNALLLKKLSGVEDAKRTARFVCTLVFIDENGVETHARGTVEGRIAFSESGEGGFGYDPLFIPDELGGEVSFADVPPSRKNEISHRGRALRELREKLSTEAE